jgi:hypothetical protein
VDFHHDIDDNSTDSLPYRTKWPKIRISPRLLSALISAAQVPFVYAAGAGDDFSNSLFTDLAPILTLFGEQVT